MKKTLLLFLYFLISKGLTAQQKFPTIMWEKDLQKVESIHRVFQNKKGNILLLGENTTDGYLAEMRPNGSFIFEKNINPSPKNGCYDPINIVEAKNGNGYIIGARQCKPSQIALTHIDNQGNTVWHFPLEDTEGANIDIVEDGLTGQIYVAAKTKNGFWVACVKTPQANGTLQFIWKKNFEINGTAARLILTESRNLVVVGYESADPYSTGLIKCLTTEGKVLWEKRFEKSVFLDVMDSGDEHIWLCGYYLTKRDNRDFLLMELLPSGELVERYVFGGIGLDVARSFVRDIENNFYLIGSSTSQTRSDRYDDMCVFKTTSKGKQLWQRALYIGSNELDIAHTGLLLSDGRLVLGGESNEKGHVIMLDKAFTPKFSPESIDNSLDLTKNTPSKIGETPSSPKESLTVKTPETQLQWLSPNPLKTGYDFDAVYERLHLEIQARSTQPLAKEHFKLFVNNKLIEGTKLDNIKIRKSPNDKAGDYTFFWETDIDLPIGKNTVEVVVTNGVGMAKSEALRPNFISKPNLYLLSVGIPSDLRYTTKDANDIVQAFKGQEGRLFQRVFADVLNTETNTTYGTLIQNIGYLKEGYQIRPQDVVVVFISSHGFVDVSNAENFYIQPSDVKRQYAPACLDFKKHIRDFLQQIKAKQLIFVDACQSGGGIKGDDSEAINKAIAQLMKAETGLRCISSSQANEKSHEDAVWENGAFTKAMKEAFANEKVETTEGIRQANANGDNILTVKELYAFLRIRVPFMVKRVKGAVQNPQAFNVETLDDFPIYVY
ncbi:MAG: caspase family protein [Saprospiraceae bacterium]|nr:caspase family protein [Saprospiraceae bacterium]